ncbi:MULTISPECIES: hypothetical protein [unclassified Psychrobacter]|uniref:hypothetical protein n=1 Tax=unclassified Psychrobacter TaxID=196806 RepID=UPI00402B928F
MWNPNLQTLLVGTIIAVGMTLSGCGSTEDDVQNPDAETSEQATTNEPIQDSANNPDLEGATVPQGTPVKYDIAAWGTGEVESLAVDELDSIKSVFGEVVSTDENSLDYASNPAAKYRFMKTDAPYLDIIDSEKYLELGWYYANPTDTDKEKELSQNHAKKAYQLSRQLMGNDGGKMVADMLNSQIIKNRMVGGQKIELAKCEFYSCMLVINKAAAQTDNS